MLMFHVVWQHHGPGFRGMSYMLINEEDAWGDVGHRTRVMFCVIIWLPETKRTATQEGNAQMSHEHI